MKKPGLEQSVQLSRADVVFLADWGWGDLDDHKAVVAPAVQMRIPRLQRLMKRLHEAARYKLTVVLK